MKTTRSDIFCHTFKSIKESSPEFTSAAVETNNNSYKFRLSLNKNLLCIEFLTKSYRDITFHMDLSVKNENITVLKELYFDFSLFNNTFIIDIGQHNNFSLINGENLSEEPEKNQMSDFVPLEVKILLTPENPVNKFCGLSNLGATCYINSLLQTMRHMHPFQKRLFTETPDSFYLTNLKRLFYAMSTKPTDHESTLVRKFITNLPFVQSVNEHQDVHEFSKILFDRLEIEDKPLIKSTIEGTLVNLFTLKCGCIVKRTEPFQDISLRITGDVIKSFDDFTAPETIDEFTCETHGKTSAERRVLIDNAPEFLFVLLSRFSFDWESGESLKNNDLCKFPDKLDIKKYIYSKGEENDTAESADSAKRDKPSAVVQSNYVLYSVIVHVGSVSQGHFYCFIQMDGKWFKFNDDVVTETTEDEAIAWNYGGKNLFTGKDKKFSAYYLVYKREGIPSKEFILESVPRLLTDETNINLKLFANDCLSGYFGPGRVNSDSYDHTRTVPKEMTISKFDSIQSVLRNDMVYELSSIDNSFTKCKETFLEDNSQVFYINQKGKGVFVKKFTQTTECNVYPEGLRMFGFFGLKSLDDLTTENIYREKIDISNESSLVEEITDFKQIEDGDILILADCDLKTVNDYLVMLRNGRYLFFDVNGVKLSLFLPKNLNVHELENKVKTEFSCPGLELSNLYGDKPTLENTVQEKNIVGTKTNSPVNVFYVGCMIGKFSIGSIPHVHPIILTDSNRDAIIKACMLTPHKCMRAMDGRDISLIQVFPNLPVVNFIDQRVAHENVAPGGMLVILDRLIDPLVICKINGQCEIVGYPIVVEKTKTIADFRKKYMVLTKIFKRVVGAPVECVEYQDSENIELKEGEYLMIEEGRKE